ncbi:MULTISPECIES: effector-associated domain EAD1-containing protein [unclassified Bradyrhizobium]|uniref:GAP1-N1 domain-containing protein n=1 Tax=unclassified Bradyrhizobium TaxID=2631580 RepID=UPI0028EE6181|nr:MULTISPECIES: effector-associated domain EAD1-containing protein [unclassified Bradyrhizobium]
MKISQALFGEVRGGHQLKAASEGLSVPAELSARLDLPDTAPPGTDWSPFVSGFPDGDWYVVARTFRDAAASRSGMVVSHALIAPLDELVDVSNLSFLFERLIATPDAPANIDNLDLEPLDHMPTPSPELPAAAALLAERGEGPVVRLGHDGFEDLIVSLWANLWPDIRRGFAFRLSFGPGDVVETPVPALVCTPPSLSARWRGHRLLEGAPERMSIAASMLSGGIEGEVLRAFKANIGAKVSEFPELPYLEQAYRIAELEPETLLNTVRIARLAERISPDPSDGRDGKRKVLDRLLLQFESADMSDVLSLRNVSFAGFARSEQLWTRLTRWIADHDFKPTEDFLLFRAIQDALAPRSDPPVQDWQASVRSGLFEAARSARAPFARVFWRIAEARPDLLLVLWECILPTADLEVRLVETVPSSLSVDAVRTLAPLVSDRRFYRLHAVAVAAAYEPVVAVRLQVAAEPAPRSEGIRLVLGRASPSEVVNCALSLADDRVVEIATSLVVADPTLLADVDMTLPIAREIWSGALRSDARAWQGPRDPVGAFHAMLTEILDGAAGSGETIDAVSRTQLADLATFPRRVELWPRIKEPARGNLMTATARGWIERGATRDPVLRIEPELQEAILRERSLEDLLRKLAASNLARAVEIVDALPSLGENRFLDMWHVAGARSSAIAPHDAEALGRLLRDRSWRRTAEDLLRSLRIGRQDVRPALRVCASLLGYWDRWYWGLKEITADEKWNSLEELAADLYPWGPDQDGLWERAGGRGADLERAGNGRYQWRVALGKLRRGQSAPSVRSLLRTMLDDYASNERLRFLVDDPEFGGHR